MSLEIIPSPPPNYAEIAAAFGVENLTCAIFCYDGKIYNPRNRIVDIHLDAHEAVHVDQHEACGGSARWWAYYLAMPAFRLEQEVPAYRAQYASFVARQRDRNIRARYLSGIATSFSSPMYGGCVSYQDAMRAISQKA